MLHVVICDDERETVDALHGYVDRFAAEQGEPVTVTEFSTGEELLTRYPRGTDVVLLDIDLGTENGLDAAEKLRRFAPDVCLIFITSLAQFAIRGYGVRAFGFLAKPVSYDVFSRELRAALKYLQRQNKHFLTLRDRESGLQRQINAIDVLYLEVTGHELSVVLPEETVTLRGSLNPLIPELAPLGFLRCHAAFLVNYRAIESIDAAELTVSNGDRVPVSKAKRRAFLAELAECVGETI